MALTAGERLGPYEILAPARSMLAEALALYETLGMPGYARRDRTARSHGPVELQLQPKLLRLAWRGSADSHERTSVQIRAVKPPFLPLGRLDRHGRPNGRRGPLSVKWAGADKHCVWKADSGSFQDSPLIP